METAPDGPVISRRRHSSSRRRENPVAAALSIVLQVGLAGVLAWSVLPDGGKEAWAWGWGGFALTCLLLVWGLRSALNRGFSIRFTPAYLILGIIALAGVIQLIPSQGLVEALSPQAAAYWDQARQMGAAVAGESLSVLPGETYEYLLRVAVLGLFLFLLLQCFRTTRSVLALFCLVVLLALGSEALGMLQKFGGMRFFFWQPPDQKLVLSGSYLNANHFALLLEMASMLLMGFLLALGSAASSRRHRRHEGRRSRHSLAAFLAGNAPALQMAGVLSLIMLITGILLSYSRGGALSVAAAGAMLTAYGLWLERSRRFVLPAVLMAAGILVVVALEWEGLFSHFESVAAGENGSYLSRLDIWSGAWRHLREFAWAGVGLGSFRFLSPIHDSGLGVDRIAYYVHNDWLELVLSLGAPLGLAAIAAGLWLLAGLARRYWRQRQPEAWLGVGAFFALLAVSLHELVDFGLQLTGNAMAAVAVLVVAIRMADNLGGDARWTSYLHLPDRRVRLTLAGSVLVLVASAALAGVLASQFLPVALAGKPLAKIKYVVKYPQTLALLPLQQRQERIARLCRQALEHQPRSYLALSSLAHAQRELAQIAIREELSRTLKKEKGLEIGPEEVLAAGNWSRAMTVVRDISATGREDIVSRLAEAADNYRLALGRAPTSGYYWAYYARLLDELRFWRQQGDGASPALWEAAHHLCPQISHITMLVAEGLYDYSLALRRGPRASEAAAYHRRGLELFRLAVEQNPQVAGRAYAKLWVSSHDAEQLRDISKANLVAADILYYFFFRLDLWPDCLQQLQLMRQLNQSRPDNESLATLGPRAFLRRHWQPKPEVEDSLLKRQVELLGLMGRLTERIQALADLRRETTQRLAPELDKARQLVADGSYHWALAILNGPLQTMGQWAAAAALRAQAWQELGEYTQASNELLRLAVMIPDSPESALEEALATAQRLEGQAELWSAGTFPVERVAQAGLSLRLGKVQEGDRKLDEILAGVSDGSLPTWSQDHLVYYLKGKALEARGASSQALAYYARALRMCPRHLPSSRRAAALDEAGVRLPTSMGQEESANLGKAVSEAREFRDELAGMDPAGDRFGSLLQLLGVKNRSAQAGPGMVAGSQQYWMITGEVSLPNPRVLAYYFARNQSLLWDQFRFWDLAAGAEMWRLGQVIPVTRELSLTKSMSRLGFLSQPTSVYVRYRVDYGPGPARQEVPSLVDVMYPAFVVSP